MRFVVFLVTTEVVTHQQRGGRRCRLGLVPTPLSLSPGAPPPDPQVVPAQVTGARWVLTLASRWAEGSVESQRSVPSAPVRLGDLIEPPLS